ncbi:hypothetical protein OE88DRAFT_1667887, partial [Heliocybe sulcata]
MLSAARSGIPRIGRRYTHQMTKVVYPHTTPFSYSDKTLFKLKFFTFCATGFSVPFIAATYQLCVFSSSWACIGADASGLGIGKSRARGRNKEKGCLGWEVYCVVCII